MKKRLTRRDFLRVGGATLAGASFTSLAACGGGGASGEPHLRITWYGDPETNRAFEAAITAFKQEHPKVSFDSTASPWEGYWDKLATQAAGGNAPDVLVQDALYIAEYAGRGALLDLSPYVGDTINLAGIGEAILSGGRVEGKSYAIPNSVNTQALAVNRAMLDEAGVNIPDYTWTYEDFANMTNDVSTSLGEGVYGTVDYSGDMSWLEVFVRQEGKEVFDSEGRLNFNKGDLTDWFAYWEELRTSGAATPPDITTVSLEGVENSAIVRRKAAVEFAFAPLLLLSLQPNTRDELGLQTLPNGPAGSRPGQYIQAAAYWSCSPNTEFPEEAAQFINSFLNDTDVIRAFSMQYGVSPSPEAREAVRWKTGSLEKEASDYIDLVATENSTPLESTKAVQGLGELYEVLARVSQELSFGRQKIDEAVDQFFSEADRVLG